MTLRIGILFLLLILTWGSQAKTSLHKADSLLRIINSNYSNEDQIAKAYFQLYLIDGNSFFSDNGRQVAYNLTYFNQSKGFFEKIAPSKLKLRYELIRYVIDEQKLSKIDQVKRCNDNLILAKELDETEAVIDILLLKSKILCENNLPEKGINYLEEALYYQKQLKNDNERIAYCNFMIGWRIYNSGIYTQDKSIVWFQKAYDLIKDNDEQLYNKCEYSGWLSNAYTSNHDFENALKYRDISMEYAKQFPENTEQRELMVFDNYRYLGQIYLIKKDYQKAIQTLEKALPLSYSINPDYTIWVATTLARAYSETNDFPNALKNINLLVKNPKYNTRDFYNLFALKNAAKIYQKYGNGIQSAILYSDYVRYSDSIQKSNTLADIGNQDLKYAIEAAELLMNFEQEKKDAVFAKEKQRQTIIRNALIAGSVLFILLIVVLYRSNKQKNKDNSVLVEQRNELDIQKREILSSITYAKRIQGAILPSKRLFQELLNDSFVLYKPKDIVAGDFYWLEKRNGITFFAAADCTGHGVPGALVSVICNNGLNRSLREFNNSNPGQILDQTREIVIQEFEKSDDVVKDGMDISLCALENNTLKWAGANNPLWIIRNNELIEYKADKQPIGKHETNNLFTSHTIQLEANDTLYLFTDGFKDQFGGESGKKFKVNQFKNLLLSIQDLSMAKQLKFLDETFEKWKGDNEQIDDVCIIGYKYQPNIN